MTSGELKRRTSLKNKMLSPKDIAVSEGIRRKKGMIIVKLVNFGGATCSWDLDMAMAKRLRDAIDEILGRADETENRESTSHVVEPAISE